MLRSEIADAAAASQHRSIAASQHRSIAASQHRSIAASQHSGNELNHNSVP
jgi:hypothetical protein